MTAPPNISFNLLDQPWIPVIDLEGGRREVSLQTALTQAHTLRDLAGATPIETASLYRLLLAVLHSALRGPGSLSTWHALWQAGTWDADWLQQYLRQWHDRFDLFHPTYPFYQVVMDDKPRTALALLHGMATGDTLFDHHPFYEGVVYSPAQAARHLLTGQTYGLLGARDPSRNMYFSGSPWLQGIVFLLEGDNLFESLALNLIRYDDTYPMGDSKDDAPYWEKADPYKPDRTLPQGYLDYLTWPSRRTRLLVEQQADGQAVVCQIYQIPGLSLRGELFDPLKQYRPTKTGWFNRCFDINRALWRDSHALLNLHNPEKTRPPHNIIWAAALVDKDYLERSRTLRCQALGMVSDNARIEFYRQERLALPLAYLESKQQAEFVGALTRGAELADSAADCLYWGARKLAELIVAPTSDRKDGRKPDSQDVKSMTTSWAPDRWYWSNLESHYNQLLIDIPADPEAALAVWQQALFQMVRASLEHAIRMAGDAPPVLKAGVVARSELNWRLNKLTTPEKKEIAI